MGKDKQGWTTADVLVERLMAQALAKGEPNRGRIALTLFRNKVQDLF
jgi:hypothetical protein